MEENSNNKSADADNPKWRSQRRFTFSDVVYNAFEPGVNHSVLLFVNCVFLLLLLTLVLIIQFSTGYKVYMVILVTLAMALFIAFNWFVRSIDQQDLAEKDDKKKD